MGCNLKQHSMRSCHNCAVIGSNAVGGLLHGKVIILGFSKWKPYLKGTLRLETPNITHF